jgi:hypothetical protein
MGTPVTNPLIPDWTTFMTRAGAHLKIAEDAFLLHDWQAGVDALGEAQQNINHLAHWLVKREIVESK